MKMVILLLRSTSIYLIAEFQIEEIPVSKVKMCPITDKLSQEQRRQKRMINTRFRFTWNIIHTMSKNERYIKLQEL